jgi:putative transcription antitermination factor YqgF
MKYLAFDLGKRHLGVAISLEGKIASPLIEVNCHNYKNLVSSISRLINQHQPNYLIIGKPSRGPIVVLARLVKKSLRKKHTQLPIFFQPEDLTSEVAKQKLFESKIKKNKRQTMTHAATAAIILQEYLDENPA